MVEFNHLTLGWVMIGYPMLSHALAQAEITHRLCGTSKTKRAKAAYAYRVVRYIPDESLNGPASETAAQAVGVSGLTSAHIRREAEAGSSSNQPRDGECDDRS